MVRALLLGFSVVIVGCQSNPDESATSTKIDTNAQQQGVSYKIETVASNLEVPWAITFAPDGRMFFTERPGRVRVYQNGQLVAAPMLTLGDVSEISESGLMGITVHPNFAQNKFVYLAYAYGRGSENVRVVRYNEASNKLTQPKTILDGIPGAPNHAGCALAFGLDGKLYITTGDATDRRIAQDLGNLGGKILRVNDDGTVPQDNPFIGRSGARGEIWAYGSRNAQGIDWHPETGMLVITEHGPSGFDGPGGGDEVNIVNKGDNLGWPTIHHEQTRTGMVAPALEFTPAVAPGSGSFYAGSKFPNWKNHYFFGALRGTALYRVRFDGRKVAGHERVITGLGRLRAVAEGPDGALYFSTSNRDGRGRAQESDDRILRIVPR